MKARLIAKHYACKIQSFIILPTQPKRINPDGDTRMPIILHRRDYDEGHLQDEGSPGLPASSFRAAELHARPVSLDVGSVKKNHPSCSTANEVW